MPDLDRASQALEGQRVKKKRVQEHLASIPGFRFSESSDLSWVEYCNDLLLNASDASEKTAADGLEDRVLLVINTACSTLTDCPESSEVFWTLVKEDLPDSSPWKNAYHLHIRSLVEVFAKGAQNASPCYLEPSPRLQVFDATVRWLQLSGGPRIYQYHYYTSDQGLKRRRVDDYESRDGNEAHKTEISQLKQELHDAKEELKVLKKKSEQQSGLIEDLRAEPLRAIQAIEDLSDSDMVVYSGRLMKVLVQLLNYLRDMPPNVASSICPDGILNFAERAERVSAEHAELMSSGLASSALHSMGTEISSLSKDLIKTWTEFRAKRGNLEQPKPKSQDVGFSSNSLESASTAAEAIHAENASIRLIYPTVPSIIESQQDSTSHREKGDWPASTFHQELGLDNLTGQPTRRPLQLNPKSHTRRFRTYSARMEEYTRMVMRQIIYAALQQASGEVSEPQCARCARGKSLWDVCVRKSDGSGRCASCIYDGKACSFKPAGRILYVELQNLPVRSSGSAE